MINSNQRQLVLVWDFPVRVFHLLLVVSFAGAWLTAEGKDQQMIHYAFGYSAGVLVLLRIIWGIVGTRYARFKQFIKGPAETIRHIKDLFASHKNPEIGHNPVGALVMIALMILMLLITLTGYWSVKEFFGELMLGAHEAISELAIVFVIVHILGSIIMSFLQKENLIKSMVTGQKLGLPEQAIQSPLYMMGLFLILAWGVFFCIVLYGALPGLTS